MLRRLLAVAGLLLPTVAARAQVVPTGGIAGTVTDEATGAPMLFVTVSATSAVTRGTWSELTDAHGHYSLDGLPAGAYSLTFAYGRAQVLREPVDIVAGRVTTIDTAVATIPEVITIRRPCHSLVDGADDGWHQVDHTKLGSCAEPHDVRPFVIDDPIPPVSALVVCVYGDDFWRINTFVFGRDYLRNIPH